MSLNSSFVSAIQTLHELDSEKKEVILFLDNQIENLPDYIQIVFIFATYFVDFNHSSGIVFAAHRIPCLSQ